MRFTAAILLVLQSDQFSKLVHGLHHTIQLYNFFKGVQIVEVRWWGANANSSLIQLRRGKVLKRKFFTYSFPC